MTSCFERSDGSTETEIEVVRSPEQLPWPILEREDNVFLTETYIRSWLSHLALGDLELVVLEGGRTLPLLLCADPILGRVMKVWKSVGWNSAWYPYSFLPPGSGSVSPFFDYLQTHESRWDGVLVTCPADLKARIESEARERRWSATVWRSNVLPYVSVGGSWDDYWNGLPKWLRVNVGRFLKRASKQGSFELRKVAQGDECERLLDRFVALHDARWGARGQRSKYVTRERHRRFLEQVVRGAFEEGRLYFPYLTLDEEPIAMAVCFLDRGKLYYVWPAFHVNYSNLAPGKLLLYHIIREAFGSGLREVDLGPGADPYKFYWTPQKREVAQILLYRGSLRLWGSYHALPRFRSAVRTGLEKMLGEGVVRRVAGMLDRVGFS